MMICDDHLYDGAWICNVCGDICCVAAVSGVFLLSSGDVAIVCACHRLCPIAALSAFSNLCAVFACRIVVFSDLRHWCHIVSA